MTKHQPRRTAIALKAILALLLATVLTGAVAGPSSAATGTVHRSRALHVTKECSQYTGLADSYCTITSSNVRAIPVGSRVVYLQAAAATSLDSDIVVVAGPGNYALGHVRLDFVTSTGEVTIWGEPVTSPTSTQERLSRHWVARIGRGTERIASASTRTDVTLTVPRVPYPPG